MLETKTIGEKHNTKKCFIRGSRRSPAAPREKVLASERKLCGGETSERNYVTLLREAGEPEKQRNAHAHLPCLEGDKLPGVLGLEEAHFREAPLLQSGCRGG